MQSMKNNVALITGSSRGIGRAIANKFAREGADIVVNYRKAGGASQAQAEELCKEIEALGCHTLIIQADIGARDAVKQLLIRLNSGGAP